MTQFITAQNAQSSQAVLINTLKPSKMNRLQRSLVKDRVPAVARDSTVNISSFLTSLLAILKGYTKSNARQDAQWKDQKRAISSLLQYWWDTYTLASSTKFEEATFQAHLAIGTDLLKSLGELLPTAGRDAIASDVLHILNTDFHSGFKLSTGLNMEILWKKLRPVVMPNAKVMEVLLKMEALAGRFDSLRWKTTITISELGGTMKSLVKAYHHLLTSGVDGESLIKMLDAELEKLEGSFGKEQEETSPFLTPEFETLRQVHILSAIRSKQVPDSELDVNIIVLANHPSTSEMRVSVSTESSRLLQSIDYLSCEKGHFKPISDPLSISLLRKMNALGDVDLNALKLLESELPIMAEQLSKSSATLCRSQLSDLDETLRFLISDVVSVYGEAAAAKYNENIDAFAAKTLPWNIQSVVEQVASNAESPITSALRESSIALAASKQDNGMSLQYSAIAWVQFAVGCITLYVPDHAFDPDKRQRLERERHLKLRESLHLKLESLQQFERMFSGQSSSIRCQLVGSEITEIGEPPVILQEIYRPQVSEIDQLQGEFSNLLKTVVFSKISSIIATYFQTGNGDGLQELRLILSNVGQIIRRLSERFRAYNDITSPVISMLRCLEIGISMAIKAGQGLQSTDTTPLALSKVVPFLGGGPVLIDESIVTSHPIEYLALAATTASTEGVQSFDSEKRQLLFKAFHGCYEQWTKRLEADKLEAESKTGLYRFKGSAEDEEEEDAEQFNELFPEYNSDSTKEAKGLVDPSVVVRETSVELAGVHASIFLGGSSPTESVMSLIRHMSKKIGSIREGDAQFDHSNATENILPGAILLLNDHMDSLSSSATVSNSFNFYTDAHLPESRKLVVLIHQIQARFRELQAVDEIGHMQPLEDVLVSCRELLQFRHTEPLAKIITKVEQVHTFMHEWQFGGWASRANSALTQYDNLTATIVNWRRLELSTWAKLFDMESKKCNDDARSWWFIAYQVVVAAPLQISDKEDELKTYAQKLLQDLEVYFSTAIVGQIVQRLQLLKQLQKHLEFLVLDVPSMAVIHSALSNFLSLYVRYEKPVQETLKKGRVSLEKAMKDVLLMASWKDTNIVALRDSAKRSHHKLFKIVRKFRALLGQPMDSIIKQGLPEEHQNKVESDNNQPVLYPAVDQSALAQCSESVPGWSQKSKRFINVSKTISMMVDATQISDSAVEGSSYLDSFLGNIISSTAELQKATPTILTEDNKVEVKHLKSRKRKLFADTLKDLRQMGIKFNLSADALAKQESLSLSLASAGSLMLRQDINVSGLDYYYHKAIDLAPSAREAVRQPSQGLSSAEVARSSGFLEGILQILLSQHNVLSENVPAIAKLEASMAMVKGLWAPGKYHVQLSQISGNHEKVLRWLPSILSVAVDIITIHSKMGKIDAQGIKNSLLAWKDKIVDQTRQWDDLARLPPAVISSQKSELQGLISSTVEELQTEIETMIVLSPGLAFVAKQILPWTTITCSPTTNASGKTVRDLNQKLSVVCDAVLVAVEKHKKAIKDLPESSDEPGWFVKHDSALVSSIKSLHSDHIIAQIEQAFEILRAIDLSDLATSKTASAIFAVALPILQQYFATLQQAVKRYSQLHRATAKASYILAKTFIQIATQGFCTPSEKSDAQDGQTEKLEGGTGLGDGEGAEDISKDIQDDENLDELAQEPNTGEKGDMEDEQDAVDMADGEMEGEMGDAEEKGSDDGGSDGESESGDEMDEEAGDVDDLDPTAVDEKMWDGDGEEAEKDQEGDDSKGKSNKDEQVAAQENDKQAKEGDERESGDEEEAEGAEQGEEVKQDDAEKHDPHAQEGEALDLPDDMELDGDEDEKSIDGSDDGMDDLSDVEQDGKEDEVANDGKSEDGAENADAQEDQNIGDDMDIVDLDEEKEEGGDLTEEAGEKNGDEEPEQSPEEQEGLLRDQNDEANADVDNAVPSDVQGTGEDQDENSPDDKTESASKAQRDDGGKGGDSSEQKDSAAEDGEQGRQANGEAPQDSRDETQDTTNAQPFKKLGEALEKWHRQQTKIREPAEQKEQDQDQNMDVNPEASEFQHLQDEDAQADTQALGTATEEQARALDETMAVDTETQEKPEEFQPDEVEKDDIDVDNAMDLDELSSPKEQDTSNAYEGRVGAQIKQAKEDWDEDENDASKQLQEEFDEVIERVDDQLESTHLNEESALELRSAADAREQWTHFESVTRDLSLSLTEQLRLILAPTLATKMRGDFRTGKRLNIKRIIPYIASQYKRDKIWMRRSVPSKRSYQIMLAVDDSKSMGESGSGSLAFETLVMVSKSLSMLEVGEICVVGFGDQVKVAHDFDTPFSSDAGPKIFQNFGFEQSRTDVTRLVRESIDLFRAAREKSSGAADLWQMELIISDGVCDSSEHDAIRRLLREALEERIMMVFVIVDDVRNKKKGESVMDLKEAKFVKDENTGVSGVKIERYLDTFPFQYYLVVSDVKELPGVLATLLRQWFAEVVDSGS